MGIMQLPILPADKAQHFIIGQATSLLFLMAGVPWSFGMTIAVALAKEIYDHYHPDTHTCDYLDAVATVAGGIPIWLLALR